MSSTYQLFQLENNEKNEAYIFLPYSEVVKQNHPIRQEDYRSVYKSGQRTGDTPELIMERLSTMDLNTGIARAISRSDVLVMGQGSLKTCYYYDPPDCIPIEGFLFGSTSSNGGITNGTRDYLFPDKDGLWRVIDAVKVEGTMFYLMAQQDTQEGSRAVVNGAGNIICEDCENGFAESVMRVIRHYLHPEQPIVAVEHPRPSGRPKLENYQKYHENGEYLRSANSEVTEEQNYNMIDGIGNNRKPRKRESVRRRLREKQQLLRRGIENQVQLEK